VSDDWQLLTGDCREVLAGMDAASVDAVVCDPPYELGFMGKAWDSSGVAFQAETWQAVLRVLKPGGHLLACGGTRTYHRLTCAIEDAGFEARDCLMWVYGSGFPKSLDVSKTIDKKAGANREVVGVTSVTGVRKSKTWRDGSGLQGNVNMLTAPATPSAQQWQGWGTALKPAYEPIIIARKPLTGTVAANVQQYGTGAINVDGCRVGTHGGGWNGLGDTHDESQWRLNRPDGLQRNTGRWPANLLHDGSDEVVGLFPQSKSTGGEPLSGEVNRHGIYGARDRARTGNGCGIGDDGSAARFFYTAKASRRERGEGNTHPTVKPLALMRYLVRLITPPGGLVCDPFAGSGTTGIAALREGFRFVGIEQDAGHVAIAEKRIRQAAELPIEAAV
jgi:hypothetical protein